MTELWGSNLNVVGTLQVPLHRIDQQEHELMIFVQEEIAS